MNTATNPVTLITKRATFSSIRAVLTETQVAALIDLREKTSAIQWQAGDLVNDIYMQAVANKQQASIMDVCFFISNEINDLFAPSTLRIYAAVAKFYLPTQRGGIMPFWLYRNAIKQGKNWHAVFQWANEFADLHARTPYEREVRGQFEQHATGWRESVPATVNLPPLTAAEFNQRVWYDMPNPEAEEIEGAIVETAVTDDLRLTIWKMIPLIGRAMAQVQNPAAKPLLAQMSVIAKQLLDLYL
jgi:hypothetical protein